MTPHGRIDLRRKNYKASGPAGWRSQCHTCGRARVFSRGPGTVAPAARQTDAVQNSHRRDVVRAGHPLICLQHGVGSPHLSSGSPGRCTLLGSCVLSAVCARPCPQAGLGSRSSQVQARHATHASTPTAPRFPRSVTDGIPLLHGTTKFAPQSLLFSALDRLSSLPWRYPGTPTPGPIGTN
jgi:hypothetical protein